MIKRRWTASERINWVMLRWVAVIFGGYHDFRGPTEGSWGWLDGLVGEPLSAGMEIESLESNTTFCLLQSADERVGGSLRSKMSALESLLLNCIWTTHSSMFSADGGRDDWSPPLAIWRLEPSHSRMIFTIPSCPWERARTMGSDLLSGVAVRTSFRFKSISTIPSCPLRSAYENGVRRYLVSAWLGLKSFRPKSTFTTLSSPYSAANERGVPP